MVVLGVYDIYLNQGSTYYVAMRLLDALDQPIDLTNYDLRAQIRSTASSATVLANFTIVKQDQTSPTGIGWFNMSLTAEQTAGIPALPSDTACRTLTYLAYDLETELNGFVTRWLQGQVILSPEVTRDE